jgi:hypothetical protein
VQKTANPLEKQRFYAENSLKIADKAILNQAKNCPCCLLMTFKKCDANHIFDEITITKYGLPEIYRACGK